MITQSAYLYRRVKRLEQRRRKLLGLDFVDVVEPETLRRARSDLKAWVDARVRPSLTDIIWRPKRDGGPYQLA